MTAPPAAGREPALRASRLTRARVLEACALPRRGAAIACTAAEDALAPPARVTGCAPLAAPLATRGVLLDLARRARGPLAPGAAVEPPELDECAERQGVIVEAGDALLLRTGFGAAAEAGERPRRGALPGLAPACARWLRDRGPVLVASDAPAVEARFGLADPEAETLRMRILAEGLLLGTDFALEALAAHCAASREYAFLLVLPVPDALGAARPVVVV